MKIQLVTENEKLKSNKEITVSSISKPKALDDYDINIIDLSCEKIWKSGFASSIGYPMDCINDLRSISNIAKNSKKTKILYKISIREKK